jgi:ABC-2 type transport system permease protein
MSRVDVVEFPEDVAASSPVPRRPRRWSGRFLGSEIGMVFRRRRNQAMLVVLGLIPVVIAIAVKLTSHPGPGGGDGGGALFNSITDNGIFVGFAALLVILPLFLPMAVAVVSGDAVSGEANLGTLRYLIALPVGRSRLLVVKYLAVVVWAFACALVVAVAGLLIGLVLFPHGDVTLLSGVTVSYPAAVWRLVLVVGYLTAMMAAVGAIGLFVSTLTEVPVAAMATTLALTITSQVLDAIPQLSSIHAWLPSHYWLRFADLLRDPLAFDQIRTGLLAAAAYIAIFGALAWARFGNKDVSS